jgi:hypothetical protein
MRARVVLSFSIVAPAFVKDFAPVLRRLRSAVCTLPNALGELPKPVCREGDFGQVITFFVSGPLSRFSAT